MAIEYRIYKGDSSGGPVDYSTVVAATSSLSAAVSSLAPSTRTRYAVRTHDTATGLDDGNTDAQAMIAVGASGGDESLVPLPPVGLRAVAGPGGTATVEWSYPYPNSPRRPTAFRVYAGTGGVVDYGTILATVAAPNRSGIYRADLPGLTGGTTYSVGVRGLNASGEEPNAIAVTVTAATAEPPDITNLASVASY